MASSSPDYEEVSKCVAGPGVNLELDVVSLYSGCRCSGKCEFGTQGKKCSCTCVYDKEGCLSDFYLQQNSEPIIECNSSCTCSHNCPNRTSQTEPCQHLIVFSTENKGLGLMSLTDLRRGSFVGEYVGEVISTALADDRLKALSRTAKCYIIQYREHLSSGTVMTTNVDATYKGNLTRFINHSCDPNLVVIPIRSNSIVPRLCLFTCTHVNPGSELSFSYFGEKTSVISENPLGRKKCFCGSPNCIGYLPLE